MKRNRIQMTGCIGLSCSAVMAPKSSHFLAQSSQNIHTYMNSDRRSYCRIFTHYAVQTFTFADLPISTTYRSVFALSSSRIRQDLLYPFLSTFCFVSVFTVCLFTNVSFLFFVFCSVLSVQSFFQNFIGLMHSYSQVFLTLYRNYLGQLGSSCCIQISLSSSALPFSPSLVPLLAN